MGKSLSLIVAAAVLLAAHGAPAQPAVVPEAPTDLPGLETYVARLEAVEAVKRLQYAFGYARDAFRADEVLSLFTEDAAVDVAGGKYKGHDAIRRLLTGPWNLPGADGRAKPAPDAINDHFMMQGVIDVAPDAQSALARFRDQVFQTTGAQPFSTAAGLYEVRFVRQAGAWKIAAMAYCEEWRNPYLTALNHTPLPVYPAPAPKLFPEDPLGPTTVSSYACHPWPYAGITPPMHYPHPVTGDFVNKP